MAQERQPLDALETRKTTLQTQNSAFGSLAGKLTALGTAADKLKELARCRRWAPRAATAVSASTATAARFPAPTTSSSASCAVPRSPRRSPHSPRRPVSSAPACTLTLRPASGDPVTISLTGSTTLEELAELINDEEDSPASASIVQVSPGTYKLVLTAKETGVSNGFTVSSAVTGGTLNFIDTDNDGVSGDTAADNSQTALNAAFTINGLSVTSATNTVEDVVPGATLKLVKKAPSTTVTVAVSRDLDKAADVVKSFITAYNGLVSFMKDQETAAAAGKTSIARDPLLRSLKDNIRDATLGTYAGSTFTALPQVGIGFDRDGKMTLDREAFDNAMDNSVGDVQRLFSGLTGSGGAFGRLSDLIEQYTKAGGLVAGLRDRLDDQVTGLTTRISDMEVQLEVRRTALQQEYIAADSGDDPPQESELVAAEHRQQHLVLVPEGHRASNHVPRRRGISPHQRSHAVAAGARGDALRRGAAISW
jgi:flagellar hook-associated protein 2